MKSTVNAPRTRTYIPTTDELNREIEVLRKECPDGDWKNISARLLTKNKTWNVTERKITKLVKRSSNNTDDQSRVSSSSSFRRLFRKSTNSDSSSKASNGSLSRFFKKAKRAVSLSDKSRTSNVDNLSVASKGSVRSVLSNSSNKADAKKVSVDAESSSLFPPLKQCESDEEEPDFPDTNTTKESHDNVQSDEKKETVPDPADAVPSTIDEGVESEQNETADKCEHGEEMDAMPTVYESSTCTGTSKDESDGDDEAVPEPTNAVLSTNDGSIESESNGTADKCEGNPKMNDVDSQETPQDACGEDTGCDESDREVECLTSNTPDSTSTDVLEATHEKEAENEELVESNVGCDDDITEIDILEIGEVLQACELNDSKNELESLPALKDVKSDLVDAGATESSETDTIGEDVKSSTQGDGTYILTFNTSEDTDDEVAPPTDTKRVIVSKSSGSHAEKSLLLLRDDLSHTNSDDSNEGSEHFCVADAQEFLGKNKSEPTIARNKSLALSLKVAAGVCLGVGLLLLPSCNTGRLG